MQRGGFGRSAPVHLDPSGCVRFLAPSFLALLMSFTHDARPALAHWPWAVLQLSYTPADKGVFLPPASPSFLSVE